MAQQTFTDRWATMLEKMLEEERARHKEILASGSLSDHGAYKYEAGTIAGLVKASELLVQSLTEIQKT